VAGEQTGFGGAENLLVVDAKGPENVGALIGVDGIFESFHRLAELRRLDISEQFVVGLLAFGEQLGKGGPLTVAESGQDILVDDSDECGSC